MSGALSDRIDETLEVANRCFDAESVSDYEELDRQIRQLEAMAREAFQGKLEAEYLSLVEKLESGTPLTGAEQEALELLMVGEAQQYLKHENDFENWKNELKRLAGEMKKVQATGLQSIDDVMHVQALCRD